MKKLILIYFAFLCFNLKAQIVINELVASNTWSSVDPDFGDYADWVEIRNTGNTLVDISGFQLTDDLQKTGWSFPNGTTIKPDSCIVLWADDQNLIPGDVIQTEWSLSNHTIEAYHLNFKLKQASETIYLKSPEDQLLDLVAYEPLLSDVSYLRSDNDLSWGYSGFPSPGIRNPSSLIPNRTQSGNVDFDKQSGYYNGNIQVSISGPDNAEIYYTLDGSIPTDKSTLYDSPINISGTTTIRALSLETDKLPGVFETATYTFSKPTLPHFYLTVNDNDLNSINYGIYSNSRKDHEVPATIEFFDENGESQFNVNAGIELFGSTIFQLAQKPFSISMKGKYGDDVLKYQLFKDKNINSFTNFVLRNGGNDNSSTMMRDGMLATLASEIDDIDYQGYRPSVVYLNGSYWGVYNIREKMNENYLAQNRLVSSERLNILEDSLDVNSGSEADFEDLITFVNNNDLSDNSKYEEVKTRIDIDAFVNYLIFKSYIGYTSFTVNNKYWKEEDNDGLWRWLTFDVEHGFGCCGSQSVEENTIDYYLNGEINEFSIVIFRALWTNEEFKNLFIQRYLSLLETTFSSTNVSLLIDSLSNQIQNEMPIHLLRWGNNPNYSNWLFEVNKMKSFGQQRAGYVKQHLLNITPTNSYSLEITSGEGGKVKCNGVLIDDNNWESTVLDLGLVELEAEPNPGYVFSHWNGLNAGDKINYIPTKDSTFTAFFILDTLSILDTIKTDIILNNQNLPYKFYGDVVVENGASLTIAEGVTLEFDADANLIVNGEFSVIGTSELLVNIRAMNPENLWGNIILDHAEDTIFMEHLHVSGAGLGRDFSFAAITSYGSILVMNECSITKSRQPVYTEGGFVQVSNSFFHMDFTGDLINITDTEGAIVENCEFRGNNEPDTDAIDYDGVIDGFIRENWIYGFKGSNSDGIDLGEESSNILIEDNEIYFCSDKGISVGQNSTTLISNNIITLCALGIAVKDEGALATVEYNTLEANKIALASYEKNPGIGGGKIYANHNIISNSDDEAILLDKYSVLELTQNISNEILSGNNNVQAFPEYNNASFFDLTTYQDSLIGANLSYKEERHKKVLFNELSYHPSDTCEQGEWVEILNSSAQDYSLDNWTISTLDETHVISETNLLESAETMVFADNEVLFNIAYPNVEVAEYFDFSFDNGGERLFLFDENGMIVNSIFYERDTSWPLDLEVPIRFNIGAIDNTKGTSWSLIEDCYGTPGSDNDLPNRIDLVVTDDITTLFPNPTKSSVRILSSNECGNYEILNQSGIVVQSGEIKGDLVLDNLPSGIYFVKLINSSSSESIRLIKTD